MSNESTPYPEHSGHTGPAEHAGRPEDTEPGVADTQPYATQSPAAQPHADQPYAARTNPYAGNLQADPYASAAAPTGPRVGTIVWGMILLLLGLAVIAVGLGTRLDLQLALVVLLAVGGVGLLLNAALRARRRS